MFVGLLLLGWYASQTKKIDIVVIIVAMAIVTFSHGIIAANPSSILATLIAATIGMFMLLKSGSNKI